MANDGKQDKISFTFTAPVRVAFANIVSAKAFQAKGQEKGDPRYGASLILDPDSPDLAALKSLVVAEAKKLFPGKKLSASRLTAEQVADGGYIEINVPWKDGTKEADKAKAENKDQEFFRGKVVVKVSSKYAPALSAMENGKFVEYTNPDTRASLTKLFYSGAWVVPHVVLNTYKAQGTPGTTSYKNGGVGLWLQAVFFQKHDTKFSGTKFSGTNSAEVFRAYAGNVTAEDPTAGADNLEDVI